VGRKRTERFIVTRVHGPTVRREPDELIVEEPLTIQLDGITVATTMRTPGHDFELAVGFCHADGLLGGAPVTGVRYCADASASDTGFNVVTVETAGRAPVPTRGSVRRRPAAAGAAATRSTTSVHA
jgi:FdhD protein